MIVVDASVVSVALGDDGADGTTAHTERALAGLAELPMQRASHRPLQFGCWELRESVTVYDAAYVALAEVLGIVLVATDRRLSRALGFAAR